MYILYKVERITLQVAPSEILCCAKCILGEMPYILKDKDFESKYGLKVEDVVLKACANPRELLKGFDVYLTPHVQPKVEDLSAIIMAAGGKLSMFLIINFSIIVWHQLFLT